MDLYNPRNAQNINEKMLVIPDFSGNSVVPEHYSILQTAALHHHITAVPKLGCKGQAFPNPERVTSQGMEAKGQGNPPQKYLIFYKIKELQKYVL